MSLVDIRIEGLKELTADIERIRRDSSFKWPKEILDGSAEMMADAISNEAVGSIKDSVRIDEMHDKRRVVVTSPHAVFVNDGTNPSPGRYVPMIGKRLINPPGGMHPGIRASHFFERAIEMVTSRIFGFAHRKIYEYLLE